MARPRRELARSTKWCWSWLEANRRSISIVLVACGAALAARRDTPPPPDDPNHLPIARDCSRLRWQLAANVTFQCLPLLLGSSSQTADFAGCASAIARLAPRDCNDAVYPSRPPSSE
jgi:hypothetical protein